MEAPGSIFAPFTRWLLEVVIFYPKNLVALGGHLAKESVLHERIWLCFHRHAEIDILYLGALFG